MRLIFAVLLVLVAWPADAKKRYARRTGQDCGHCHQNPQGGGPRNPVGLYYQAHRALPPPSLTDGALQAEVDRYLDALGRAVPEVVWRWQPLDQLPDAAPAPTRPAADLVVLRRLALDLRGALPSVRDIREVESGAITLEQIVERYLGSDDFVTTFRLYHADLVRSRSGIFNQTASLTQVVKREVGEAAVWTSTALPAELARGDCRPERRVKVSPYWDRSERVEVCRQTADTRAVVDGVRCDTEVGQQSGRCGCGPHLVFCYREGDYKRVKKSMVQEASRLAMEVVERGLPYGRLLTADWTMHNGRLEHFYARLEGRLGELSDADVYRPWARVERGPEHAGILTTHAYLNHFYNGRRWAQRTFEAFMCHLTVPDYDLLDDHAERALVAYRRHPEADPDVNVSAGRACAACHMQLDGLSRVKDRWDNFGQYYPASGGRAIPQTVRFLDADVDGVDAFAARLAGSQAFADCVSNQLWSHFMGRRFGPDEIRIRRALVERFADSGQDFKAMIRAIVSSPAYRAVGAVKLMTREQYRRAMGRVTGVRWRVGDEPGFDLFYDKVGGMDYRKIEERDRTPGQGHSLVQFKAAVESCDVAVERARVKPRGERTFLQMVDDVDAQPDDAALDRVIEIWFRRILVRPVAEMTAADRETMRALFRDVADAHGPAEGYKAICATYFASADFAVY